MSVFRHCTTVIEDLATPLLDTTTHTVSYKPLQKSIRWIVLLINVTVLAMSIYMTVMASRSIAIHATDQPTLVITSLVFASLGICTCALGVIALQTESYRALLVYVTVLSTAALTLLGISLYFMLHNNDITPEMQWAKLSIGTRVVAQHEWSCCGLYQFNDSYSVQPCLASASTACAIHMRTIGRYTELAAVGVGCSCATIVLALMALLLQRSFRIKHQFMQLHLDDAVPV